MSRGSRFQVLDGGYEAATGRTMPMSEEAEQHVLACCLIDGRESIERALLEGINELSFYTPANREIWGVIVELYRKGVKVDIEILASELQLKGVLDRIGGGPKLVQITAKIPTTAHLGYFAHRCRELAACRWLILEATKIVEQTYAYAGTTDDTPNGLEDVMRGHVSTFMRGLAHVVKRQRMPKSLAQEIEDVAQDFVARAEGRVDKSGWIYTGWGAFDQNLLPLGCQREDNLVMLGGWSGFGKSAKAGQIVGATVDRGQRARVYSMEVSTAGFIELMVARKIGVDLRRPEQIPADLQRAFVAECRRLQADVADKRLWCVQQGPTTPLRTIEDLEADARLFAKMQGVPHLWVIDYAQLLETQKRTNNREQANAVISTTLQGLARELGGVWLVCLQLNEANRRESLTVHRDKDDALIHRFPDRGDIRESQRYYHDADRVLFIYRPPENCRGDDQSASNSDVLEQWIVQDKRRRGGGGKFVKGWFERRFTRFRMFGQDDLAAAAMTAAQAKPRSKSEWRAQHGRK